jgi:hypothetical protein
VNPSAPYYQALSLPLEADRFVVGLQEKMRKALDTFDTGLARNPRVRINEKAGGWISVTPLTAQPEPTNLAYGNQAVILRAWGRLEEAMALHKEQEALCLELGDKDGCRGATATRP